MEKASTPRVSCSYLNSYVGVNVMLVGKVMQLRGESALLDSEGNVTAHLTRDSHLQAGNAAQIIGKVNPDLSIKVLSCTDLGNNVDYNVYQAVVDATHQFKPLFVYD